MTTNRQKLGELWWSERLGSTKPMWLAAAAITLCLSARADEWWDRTPFYEEEEWYDVTEWFDGNDYKRTDEPIFRWNEDQRQAAQDRNGGLDYDYESDPSASDEDHYASWPFGYTDTGGEESWFYDYWDDGFVTAVDSDGDGFYDYVYRYANFDGDGAYDAYWTFINDDDDDSYDDIRYYTFNEDGSPQDQAQRQQQRQGQAGQGRVGQGARGAKSATSRAEQIRGEVVRTKQVNVRDQQHLVAEIRD